jgi:hypothetical protein
MYTDSSMRLGQAVRSRWNHIWTLETKPTDQDIERMTQFLNAHIEIKSLLVSINPSTNSPLWEIGHKFLAGCVYLSEIEFTDQESVLSQIGDGWMSGCSQLTRVQFNGLSNLRIVGDAWMSNCTALTTVDFNSWPTLEIVDRDNNKMEDEDNNEMEDEDLTEEHTRMEDRHEMAQRSGLPALHQVGKYWLAGCSSLTSLNLRPLSRLTFIGKDWLTRCSQFRHLDLSVLRLSPECFDLGFLGDNGPCLTTLNLTKCSISDQGLDLITAGSPLLVTLILNGCIFISNAGLKLLKGNCSNLAELDLQNLTRITDEGIKLLSASRFSRKLHILKLTKSGVVPGITEQSMDYARRLRWDGPGVKRRQVPLS